MLIKDRLYNAGEIKCAGCGRMATSENPQRLYPVVDVEMRTITGRDEDGDYCETYLRPETRYLCRDCMRKELSESR